MDPIDNNTPIQQDGGPPLGAQPPADPPAPAAGAQPPAPTPGGNDPKVMVVPHAQMGKIKAQAEAKGKAAALDELAQGAGFDSPTDLIAALQQLKAGGGRPAAQPAAQPPAAQPDPAADPAADPSLDPKAIQRQREDTRLQAKYDRQLQKAMDERNRFANSARDWERKAKEAQASVDAAEARMAVREIAVSAGIQDLDYAERLFEREVNKLTPEQAEKFDEKAFFVGLRTKMPYLFGETQVPANTGNAPGGAPPPAIKPGTPPPPNGNGKQVKDMNRQEYQQHLRTKGINPNAV